MSLGGTENTIRNKLMEILEEELSVLKLKDNDKHYEIDNDHPNDDEGDADKESFSSSSDTTAEILKEDIDDQNEDELNENENFHPTTIIAAGEMQHLNKCQHKKKQVIDQEKAIIQENERSAETPDKKIRDEKVRLDKDDYVPPPYGMAEKIRQKAESYFEDYNLFKNSFLLSHIRRNKKGYVSVKLMSSLRKIRSITRDFRDITYSLKDSKILELNPEGNKIRRIEPIPKIEDTSFGKTLMVFNLPSQNLSPESLREMFSKFGTVVSAGIYEIDYPASDIYHQRCFFFHRKIASKVYGIVEFEKYEEVVKALKDEEGHLPKENEVKAVPLLPQIYQKEKKYLKFLNPKPYNHNPRRGYERYKPRNDFYREETLSADMRNDKMNIRGGYNNKRGYFRRSYRGRQTFMPSNTKSYGDYYYHREWNQPFRGGMPKKWGENRYLRTNNSLNIDRPGTQRKRTGNGYMNNGI